MRRWIAWRELHQAQPNRAPAVVILWHALVKDTLFVTECNMFVSAQGSQGLLRLLAMWPEGNVCTECAQIVRKNSEPKE